MGSDTDQHQLVTETLVSKLIWEIFFYFTNFRFIQTHLKLTFEHLDCCAQGWTQYYVVYGYQGKKSEFGVSVMFNTLMM